MKLTHEILTLRTKNPFFISRGGASEYRVVRITVTDRDGGPGWGEAGARAFYGETADKGVGVLPILAAAIAGIDSWSVGAMEHAVQGPTRFNHAAPGGGSGG